MKKILVWLMFAILASSVAIAKPTVCGNGIIDNGEKCDDGNLINGDGCSDKCKIECKTGAIWTTLNDCGDSSKDENQYNVGDKVYINGDNFCEDSYDWSITGQPGGASCDPRIVVASGSNNVDSSGAFCFEAYTVATDDCGTYSVDFANKHDNYHIKTAIPEFTVIGSALALVGACSIFFARRRR